MSSRSPDTSRWVYLRGIRAILRAVNLRHLTRDRRRAALTVGGVSAAVCLLVAIGAIDATLKSSIAAETHGLAGAAAFEVLPAGTTALNDGILRSARDTPGVTAAVPVLADVSSIRHGGRTTRLVIFAVSGGLAQLFPGDLGGFARRLREAGEGRGGLIPTAKLAGLLDLRAGDPIAVETPRGYAPLRAQSSLGHSPFASVNGGVFAIMALPVAQRTFDQFGEVDGILIAARAGISRRSLRAVLQRRLGSGAIVSPPGGEGTAYERTFAPIAAIGEDARTVGLFVAFFLVLNTMAMALAERRSEIALLALGGARRGQIVSAFVIEAALLGAVAGGLGVLGGALLAHLLIQRAVDSYNVLPITAGGPLVLGLAEVLLGLGCGIGVTVLGALLPAWGILRVAPVQALRPEAAYEWGAKRLRHMPTGYTVAGGAAVALSPLLAGLLPVGSSLFYAGLVLVMALLGVVLLLPFLVPALAVLVRHALLRGLGPSGRLAGDGMLRTPGRTIVTAGGVAMAAALSIAIGVGIRSYEHATEAAAAVWYEAPLYVNPRGATAYLTYQPLQLSVVRELRAVRGVGGVFPMDYGIVNTGGEQTIFYAMPIAEAAAAGYRVTGSLGIPRKALIGAMTRGEAVISRLMARRRHLAVGDTMMYAVGREDVRLRVGGLFNDIASSNSVCVDYHLYETLTRDPHVDRIAVAVRPGADVGAVGRRLQRVLDEHGVPATVLTRGQMVADLVNSIRGLFTVAQGVQIAALLIAALIVLCTMLTAIFERRWEIGIERLLGLSFRRLRGSIVLEAVAISLVGAAVAVGLGLGLGFLITLSIEAEVAWRVAFRSSPAFALGIVALVVAIGAAAALYPSWLATRERIVSLLRVD